MSMKVPAVVSKDAGCHSEFIESWRNGVLLDPYSDSHWGEAIVRLLKDPLLRRRIGQEGHEFCKREFDVRDTAKKIEGIYAEISAS
jgi:glycosyltransferase involved in cell wall biosynthesis